MKANPETYERGLALLNKLHGGHSGEAIVQGLKDICPDFATMTSAKEMLDMMPVCWIGY